VFWPLEGSSGAAATGAPAMAKKARAGVAEAALRPEDLNKGSIVLFYGDRRGVVTDAFVPLDQFWVADEATNELIRDDEGNIVPFSVADLKSAPLPGGLAAATPTATGLGAAVPVAVAPKQGSGCARVLLLGTEQQMLQVLEQFGAPEAFERRDPQQLLCVPCSSTRCSTACARFDPCRRSMCNRDECSLLQLATDGIDDAMFALARRLRPDIFIDVRPFHLKQAVEQVGPDITKLADYYCLCAVTLPYGQADIVVASGWERFWMEDVRCQIDLGVSAEGASEAGEASLEDTAKRALGEACGLCLAEAFWTEELQLKIRKGLGVDIPLKFWDGETKVFVLILPPDAAASTEKGLLMFFPGQVAEKSAGQQAPGGASVGGKTIAEWQKDQDQFRDLPRLPAGWIRIRSRTNHKEIYYWNLKLNKASHELPLPEGWTKQTSKTTGKTYYFNAKKRKSTFDVPTE